MNNETENVSWLISRFCMMNVLLKCLLSLMNECGQTHKSTKYSSANYMDVFDTHLSSAISDVIENIVRDNDLWMINPKNEKVNRKDYNSYVERELRSAWNDSQQRRAAQLSR